MCALFRSFRFYSFVRVSFHFYILSDLFYLHCITFAYFSLYIYYVSQPFSIRNTNYSIDLCVAATIYKHCILFIQQMRQIIYNLQTLQYSILLFVIDADIVFACLNNKYHFIWGVSLLENKRHTLKDEVVERKEYEHKTTGGKRPLFT